jgi:ornithine cyclodeaminase/alanine dehydrogenase-like protein (mu-crystallin family)
LIYLPDARVRELLEWDALIAAMEDALASFSTGRVRQPVRTVLAVEENRRYLGIMPVVGPDVMGAKIVSFYPVNESTRHPTHNGAVVVLDSVTGVPMATMDARSITEMRTAAVSAAVTKYAMPENAGVLAVLGSGVQARAHVAAISRVMHVAEIRIWSRNADHAARFADECGGVVCDARDAVRGAQVVVVATSSSEPVLQGAWLDPGAHVNSVGANHPSWRELDDDVMRNTLLVDSREAAAVESCDVIGSHAMPYAEVGELFAGTLPWPERGRTTVFKSMGLAVEDLAAAKLVLERLALQKGDV